MHRHPGQAARLLQVTLVLAGLFAGGSAQADGGALAAQGGGNDRVIGQLSFRCKGGVRVQVTQLPNRARVEFAGRSRVLYLASGGGGVLYSSAEFAWVSDGRVASMRENRSGRLALSDCVQVK